MTPYYKDEWYDDTPIGVGDIVQLTSMSFGIVVTVLREETEDGDGNVIAVDDEYVTICLYTGRTSTESSRQPPTKFKREYLNDILSTAPYHRWIYENYDEFYSKDPEWMDWFVMNSKSFTMTIRSYVEKADDLLKLQGATWESERPSEEWQAAFWAKVEKNQQIEDNNE